MSRRTLLAVESPWWVDPPKLSVEEQTKRILARRHVGRLTCGPYICWILGCLYTARTGSVPDFTETKAVT